MTYYLVQRLESRNSDKAGFDGFFALDYMGSSEFEWGAIPRALKSVRQQKVVARGIDVTIGAITRTVYFVGHSAVLDAAATEMQAWAVGSERRPPFWGKEYTGFPEAFNDAPDPWRTTDAWWGIEEDVAWALSPEVADRLVAAFNTRTLKPVTTDG